MTKQFKKLTALLAGVITVGLFPTFAFAQAQIKGTVLDVNSKPLEGASIKVRGEKGGTTTKADGSFEISLKEGKSLEVSDVGYNSQTVKVTGGSVIVKLSQDNRSLSEIVVTGTGVATSKKKLGIAVQSITADKLPAAPTASLDQALVGKIPGAQISSIDGTPGAKVNILLRGVNTLQRGTKPMILLDGAELGVTDISQIDLSNVERVEVVQGAASAALYGAQGANGVIQIFTKKGRKGKTAIDISSSVSSSEYINSGNVHKAMMHSFATDANNNILIGGALLPINDDGTYTDAGGTGIAWANGANAAAGFPTAMSNPKNINNKAYNANFKYYDQFSQLFKKGYTVNNNITFSGGSDKSDYSVSISNNKQVGSIVNNGDVNRTNFGINFGTELFKGLKLRSVTGLVYTKNTLNQSYGTQRNNIYNMLNVSPFYDLTHKLADGSYPYYLYAGTVSVNGYNPLYDFDNSSSLDNEIDLVQNLQLNYKVNKFIDLDAKYSINFTTDNTKYIYKNQSKNLNVQNWGSWAYRNNADLPGGEIDQFNSNGSNQNAMITATIKTDFQKDFNLKAPITTSTFVGFDYRGTKNQATAFYGNNLPTYTSYLLQEALNPGVENLTKPTDNPSQTTTVGYLITQKIEYGELGGLTVGFRHDKYSTIAYGVQTPFFPHADGYFRISSLNNWSQSKIGKKITDFKIRAAYGEAGIQPFAYDRQPTLRTGNVGTNPYVASKTNLVDPSLRIEQSKEFEIGTDVTIKTGLDRWLSSINFSYTNWSRKSKDVIYQSDVVNSAGASTITKNAIGLSSKGYEFSLNLSVLKSKNFNWDFTTNWGHQSSMIDAIDGPPIVVGFSGGSTNLVLTAGEKIGQLYGYRAFRDVNEINQTTGKPYISSADAGKYQIVDGRLVDTLTKAIQFTLDKYPLGDPNPKFNASFINSISYKDYITVGFQFDWVYGSHIYNQTKEWMYRDGISGDYDKAVTINGQTAAYTAYYRSVYAAEFGNLNGDRNATKDYFYEDASFVRLRNVSLGVDFARAFNIKGFRKLQLVLSGRNLWTKTKYTGFDPEISSGNTNSSLERGIDHNSMPNVKSYQVSLNIGF